MKTTIKFVVTAAIVVLCVCAAGAQVSGNPPFTINQSVVASGGGTSAEAGNIYKIEGVIGQPVAGTTSSNASYTLRSGFFTPAPFSPTAALAKVGGRVTTSDGRGIRNIVVVMANGNSLPRVARTSTFGYFSFEDVPVGEVYILSVRSKRYRFNLSSQVVSLFDDITDISFVADEL